MNRVTQYHLLDQFRVCLGLGKEDAYPARVYHAGSANLRFVALVRLLSTITHFPAGHQNESASTKVVL